MMTAWKITTEEEENSAECLSKMIVTGEGGNTNNAREKS